VSSKQRKIWITSRGNRPAIFLAIAIVASVIATFGGGGSSVSARETIAANKSGSLKSLLAHLQSHYQETDSFSAAFKQTITRVGAPPKERTGTVYYQKPGRVRFEFGDPQPETIVSDGNLLYDYDPGLNQVMETPLKNAIKTQAAAAFLLGVGNVQRDFKAKRPASQSNDDLNHVLLTPRNGGDDIEIGLDPHTMNIMSLRLADALGNVTELHFNDIQTNIPIEASRFEFKAPDGVDVVTASGAR